MLGPENDEPSKKQGRDPCVDHGLSGNKPQGYHQKRVAGRLYYVHRLAYAAHHAITIDAVPPLLRHTCDNPRCVNPVHLIPGTHADNSRDRVERGRCAKRVPTRHVLTQDQQQIINDSTKNKTKYARENSERSLARKFGVSRGAIVAAKARGRAEAGVN